jgi:hypothetical protein
MWKEAQEGRPGARTGNGKEGTGSSKGKEQGLGQGRAGQTRDKKTTQHKETADKKRPKTKELTESEDEDEPTERFARERSKSA